MSEMEVDTEKRAQVRMTKRKEERRREARWRARERPLNPLYPVAIGRRRELRARE
jgi:hypothetical protein